MAKPSGTDAEADLRAFADALGDLDRALDSHLERTDRMRRRIKQLREALEAGRSLREIVPLEQTPPLVGLLTQSAENLQTYGSRVRRTEARALYREGLTMEEIAGLFGVTRQRVSALLRERE